MNVSSSLAIEICSKVTHFYFAIKLGGMVHGLQIIIPDVRLSTYEEESM